MEIGEHILNPWTWRFTRRSSIAWYGFEWFLRLANRSIQRPTSQRIFRNHSVGGGSLKLALSKKSIGCSLITTSFQKMTVSVGSATKLKFIASVQTNLRAEAPMTPMEYRYISFILHIYISSFFVFWWRTRHNHTWCIVLIIKCCTKLHINIERKNRIEFHDLDLELCRLWG